MDDWAERHLGLLERDRELATLARAVDDLADGTGSVLLVEGAAGTGKSALLSALGDLARRADLPLSVTRAVELDASLPFAIVRRALEPPLRSASGRAGEDPRARRALATLNASARGSLARLAEGATATAYAIVEGVEGLVDVVGRFAIVVDDAQWADAGSLRLLGYLAERARELPIILGVAVRRGDLDDGTAARFRAAAGATVLEPRELSLDGVARLLERRLPGAAAEVVAACRRVTGGNPFMLSELLVAVDAAGIASDPDAATRIGELAPQTVIDGVLVRLGRLPRDAGELARAVAVLGDGARLRHAARLANVTLGAAARLTDLLVTADILDGGDPLGFRHPLIAAAVLGDVGRFTRAELHRRAARVLAAEGCRERAAAHLLHAPPAADPHAVSQLRAAAAAACARGDAGSARRFLLRALEEPPNTEVRPQLLVELARAETAIGDPEAVTHMEAAVASIRDGERAAAVLRELSRLQHVRADYATAAALAEQALAQAGPDAPDRDRLRATWLLSAGLDPPRRPAFSNAAGELVAATRAGAPPSDAELQAIVALLLMASYGDPAEATRLAVSAMAGEIRDNEDGLGLAFGFALSALHHAGALRVLAAVATNALHWADERGSVIGAAAAALWRGLARLRLGDLDGAEADAAVALVPWRFGWTADAPHGCALLARVCLERGDRTRARETIDAAAAIDMPHPPYIHASGIVRMAEGDAAGALERFRQAGELLESVWRVETPAVLPWRSAAALAALRAGRPREAAALAAAEVGLARRTGVRSVVGVALCTEGLVRGGPLGIARLREARDVLAGTDDALEAVRAQAELGGALRRAGLRAEARAELRAARDRAEELRLPALAARAAEEERASGGRPRRTRLSGAESLTPSERRIADRAGAGASNRQIAAELFLTTKTVEWHMSNVFRKLGVTSRAELADALADRSAPVATAR